MPVSEFKFDEVLRQHSTQGDVYAAAVEPVVADVLNGYNGTVMAYGQTGAPSHHARQPSFRYASSRTSNQQLDTACMLHALATAEQLLHQVLKPYMSCRRRQDLHAVQPGA